MTTAPTSRAVQISWRLVNVLLVIVVAFSALAVVSLGVGLARDGDSLLYGSRLTVPLQLNPDDVGPLPAAVRVSGWPDVGVDVRDPTPKQLALRSAMDFGLLALFIAGLWLLRGFARSVKDGDPFGGANVARLRGAGYLLVVGAPLVELLNTALRTALYDDLPAIGAPPVDIGTAGFAMPAGALIGGLAAFVLAEVFAQGVRLRADVEGTV